MSGLASGGLSAQTNDQAVVTDPLFAGDSVRVDGSVVGRVLSVEGNHFTLLSRGKPVCRAGQMHGDAPICDPAPVQRQTLALDEVKLERRMARGNRTAWTLIGGVAGTALFAGAGYLIGPSVGFGKVDGCLSGEISTFCEDPVTRERLLAEQEARDQKRGALFFGVIGGTFSAIMARKLSVGWIEIHPVAPATPDEAWGVGFTLPSN